MKIAVIGATGLVGSTMIKVLSERCEFVSELIPVASQKSVGSHVYFNNKSIEVISIDDAWKKNPDIALFSAGSGPSIEWAPRFSDIGCYVIDNSSAWRMNPDIPLIVPEVNINRLSANHRIIANPNCSTIQMMVALNPIHREYKIKRIVVSTYQSVSGSGQKAVNQLMYEENNGKELKVYPHPIYNNIIPQIDQFTEDGYTKEEWKMIQESRKILGEPEMRITATTVRVPVFSCHSESVNIETEIKASPDKIKDLLSNSPGIIILDNPESSMYPMPVLMSGKDEVAVGRIRRDYSLENGINLWIVADNIRKGAATNAVQIVDYIRKTFLKK